ncbi:MAG: NAD(P)-dependent oxidoreductase [Planctomycetota bacterium]
MTTPPPRHLGFIGLGIMGQPMASNLMSAGHRLTVWNRTPSKANALVERGATLVASPAEVAAAQPEVIFLNVTNTPDVEAIVFGDQGLTATASPGLILVDHSTISPVETQRFAQRLQENHQIAFLDAPVSGGDIGAKNGTLSIMVGGEESTFDQVRLLLEVVGKNVTYAGPSGMGQACKACNQLAVSGALLGVVEALALAKKMSLDSSTMIDVVSGGAGGSWQLANLGPKIAAGDHAPGFFIDYLRKDLAIAADTAEEYDLPLALLELAERLFAEASQDGAGQLGTQAIARFYEKHGGFTFA